MIFPKYDVIVIGAGHAGLEAAFSCSKAGLKIALVTLKEESIGACPCNPSVGGPAKGIVTREIDALGGMQGIAADINQLQMKLLNESKGAGVQALRAQIDKIKYHEWFFQQIKKQKNLDLIIDEAISFSINNNKIDGVYLKQKGLLKSKYVCITTGTYLKSKTFSGFDFKSTGPIYDYLDKGKIKTEISPNSNKLSDELKKYGFQLVRLKTGTPPRIYKSTIKYDDLSIHPGTNKKLSFEHFNPTFLPFKKQVKCWMTYTNEKTHKIIRENINLSPMYAGVLKSVGPRYCPSIEDKVMRFSDKPRHQLFIEPESMLMDTVYLQGFSTTFPIEIQDKLIKTLPGFENCKVQRYAYAIEYDAIEPTQLKQTLESKAIKNLYFAGQINGTSGYEEAAGQGLIAGLNIIRSFYKMPPLILNRAESYIGVMIDDITTKGITDPYRLLTSRAEYRLLLRHDNADDRLIKYGYESKTITKKQYSEYIKKNKIINSIIAYLNKTKLNINLQKKYGLNKNLYQLLKRPEVKLKQLIPKNLLNKLDDIMIQKIQIMVKFDGYIISQNKAVERYKKMSNISLTTIKDYKVIKNLSLEAIAKLNKIKPITIAQAQQIQGITSNDIIVIKYYLDTINS
ncbi:MAG: tRNA uridine-5-carboxymethylaminomethyl(34) synthesis enzyme MnmG [Mycoplasmataceae bacterium]|jgi:tRNA uridine 5-carboxymethylaminomethyl modification enzyme|nr:tRNA uridine-5-carboxymethylaminomethyl(34) synthesis enzyme MnmG [Mycoplasmataceae bacterium]